LSLLRALISCHKGGKMLRLSMIDSLLLLLLMFSIDSVIESIIVIASGMGVRESSLEVIRASKTDSSLLSVIFDKEFCNFDIFPSS
jgi:hypothetical protein